MKRDWKMHVLCVVFVIYVGYSFMNMPKQAVSEPARPPVAPAPIQGQLKGADPWGPRDPRPVGDIEVERIFGKR